MTELPTGTVTLLFTDIEGSTRLIEAQPAAFRDALARHDDLLQHAITMRGGVIFRTGGDSVSAAFVSPTEAISAALDAQRALQQEAQATTDPIKVRMGLHTGLVEIQGGQYFGLPLHRCARLMSSAHGGQVLLSAATAALVRDTLPPDATIKDLGEHHLRDLAHSERVYQLIVADLPADFPPLRSLAAIPHNLPLQATAFIGREHQLQAVRAALLRTDTRLLTLTGPGGTGKTRLALQVATDLLDSFPDGVYFVALSSVTDPTLVPSEIAQTLDVRESPDRSIMASLQDFLHQKQVLLVVDNFEQVVAAAPAVAELIAAASGLRVLVTSRAVLRLYGEREIPVPPMALPDRRASPSAAHLAQFEAVHLFADRAQAARPDFAVTDENAADVAEICHRLDGLPLAIELAAARLRALPPHAMLQRMERRLPLLTGGARDLPARQRTLRDAIAWSYDLLEPSEQVLFRRLGVFRGCTLEMAETVCAGDPPRPGATSVALPPLEIEVLDGLESLVEKSLLRQEERADGQPWYLMLETVREFALERLEQSGEASAVHRRHALAALKLAETSEQELHGTEQRVWLARLEQEHDNLRAALRWCEEQGYAEPALRLAVALWWFWSVHGHVSEGRERFASLLTRFPIPPSSPRAGQRARALYAAGMLASVQGDHAAARALHEEGLELRRLLDDQTGVFASLEGLGTVACFAGDYAAARRYLEEALAVAQELGAAPAYGSVLNTLGNIYYELGDLDLARTYFEEGRTLLMDAWGQSGAVFSLAAVALDQGNLDEAEALAARALTEYRQLGNRRVESLALATLGAIMVARGNHAAAREHLSKSIAIQHEQGDVAGVAQVLERFVGLAVAQGRAEGALRLAGAATALYEWAGAPLQASGQARLERVVGPARHALSPEDAAEAWRAGRGLETGQAVEAALAITDLSVPLVSPERPALSPDAAASVLTRREQEVAVLIAQGLTNRQIAEALVITEGTAANHVVHILNKLGFNSRAQIAAWAAEHGL